ncbi:MAG TPA: TlpA disulfide reductase family protein [Aestuariivirga sp.]|nr:TlpA disulfide reductase family protein [Aestuariivirga sp.]
MNDPKRNRNSLIYVALLAFIAGGLGIYLSGDVPRKVAEVNSGGGFKGFAVGPMAAFLVKADRPPVPDLAFKDSTGSEVTLSKWQGRVVLLNLWATWCAPCRKEMPTLNEVQKQLGSKDFEVVALSVDRKGLEASAAFLKETKADALGLYIDETTTSLNMLQSLGLPVTLLIDRKGREIGRLLGPAEWNSAEAIALMKAALAEAP